MGFGIDDRAMFYHIKVKKKWFMHKCIFNGTIGYYENMLAEKPLVRIPMNASNMIYTMMCRLRAGVDWEKQDALVASYRTLMYRLSYVDVLFKRNDLSYFHVQGQKTDVMWALAFITQVYPDEVLVCEDVNYEDVQTSFEKQSEPEIFEIQNGVYVGETALKYQTEEAALPNIWDVSMYDVPKDVPVDDYGTYDSEFVPKMHDKFAIPDGRMAEYIRMDVRFNKWADVKKRDTPALVKHNISASLIKDFEDLVSHQSEMDFDLYQLQYVAFMNKVHTLEAELGGLDVSCYDLLPIGERGLPFASNATITRTNWADKNSLKYALELYRNIKDMNVQEAKKLILDVSKSVLYRIAGYNDEYRYYQESGSSEAVCFAIRSQQVMDLYEDFVDLENLKRFKFPIVVYRALCNAPSVSIYKMTEFERMILKTFGRGYADFLTYQIQKTKNRMKKSRYEYALKVLQIRYLGCGKLSGSSKVSTENGSSQKHPNRRMPRNG